MHIRNLRRPEIGEFNAWIIIQGLCARMNTTHVFLIYHLVVMRCEILIVEYEEMRVEISACRKKMISARDLFVFGRKVWLFRLRALNFGHHAKKQCYHDFFEGGCPFVCLRSCFSSRSRITNSGSFQYWTSPLAYVTKITFVTMKKLRTIQKTSRHWVSVCSGANTPTMYGVIIPVKAPIPFTIAIKVPE